MTTAWPLRPRPWRGPAARTLTIAQIETVEGLDDVEAIAATPGVDVVWLGHFDLSNFMGIPGQFQHPDFIAAARRSAAAAASPPIPAPITATDRRFIYNTLASCSYRSAARYTCSIPAQ
jgi:2-keto-3-deoxy-L-rhamnonate aldolase RhmA